MNKNKYLRYLFAMRLGALVWAVVSACGVHAADTLTIAATRTAMPMLKILIDDFTLRSPEFKATLLYPPAGSGGAIRGVATGKVDLGVTSRVPSPDAPGSDLRAVPWVRTAFVIAAHHADAGKNYTLPELAAIWSGATLRWPDGQPMRLLLRSADDADLASLRAIDALEAYKLANEVVVLRDGAESLDYLYRRGDYAKRENGKPAVILLDLKMPKVVGGGRYRARSRATPSSRSYRWW